MYRSLFFETGEAVEAGNMGLLEGMVLLWGTEIVRDLFFVPLILRGDVEASLFVIRLCSGCMGSRSYTVDFSVLT